jgi:hypothetical protein
MRDLLQLALALVSSTCGMAWLALAMKVHWQQVRGSVLLSNTGITVLRILGAVAIALSLWLYLGVDHGSMASLVWVMSLAASALIVALTLTWAPRRLAPLSMWVRG